jgi:hypothetical protein
VTSHAGPCSESPHEPPPEVCNKLAKWLEVQTVQWWDRILGQRGQSLQKLRRGWYEFWLLCPLANAGGLTFCDS